MDENMQLSKISNIYLGAGEGKIQFKDNSNSDGLTVGFQNILKCQSALTL